MTVPVETSPQEPNLVIPLATSYQPRDITGYTTTVTNAVDQRKINCIYEPIQNGLTDTKTLYIAKRPGVASAGTHGSDGQISFLFEVGAGATSSAAANRWVFSTNSNDVRASDTSSTNVIVTASGYNPAYVDKGVFQGNDTVILQLRNASGTQRVFYSTTIGTWAEITDSDFASLVHRGKMEFMPGRGFIMSGSRIYNSDLDSISDWSATSFLTKQVTQDIGTGLARLGNLILAFGESTMEAFHDIGNPTGSPLEALPEKFQRVGLGSPIVTNYRHYYTTLGQRIYWVSSNPKAVYAYDGNRVEKVSSIGIDKILAERQHYNISTITLQGQTGIIIALDAPNTATQRMLVFFPEWNDWFEWTSAAFQGVTSARLQNVLLGGGTNSEFLYGINEAANTWQDQGVDYTMSLQFKLPSTGNHIKRMSMCGVVADTARSASSLNVSWSNDDYQNFSTTRAISLTTETKMLQRCGAYRNRIIKLEHTGNLNCRMEKFIARID